MPHTAAHNVATGRRPEHRQSFSIRDVVPIPRATPLALAVGLALCTACMRPGLSNSADPRTSSTQNFAGPAAAPPPAPAPATAADQVFPYAGALAVVILAFGGLMVVILGFRLINQLVKTNGTTPARPTPT